MPLPPAEQRREKTGRQNYLQMRMCARRSPAGSPGRVGMVEPTTRGPAVLRGAEPREGIAVGGGTKVGEEPNKCGHLNCAMQLDREPKKEPTAKLGAED